MPLRIMLCQPGLDPLTATMDVKVPCYGEDGPESFRALRERLVAEVASGDAAHIDRAVRAVMVKW
jgi:hypothetical protein